MRVLQHFVRPTEPPVGVWWEEFGTLKSAYAHPETPEEVYARTRLAQKLPEASWDDMFSFMENTMSPISQWEASEVHVSPEEYLSHVRRFKRSA